MSPSPYDDGWLLDLDLVAVEIRLNDPRTISVRGSLLAGNARRLTPTPTTVTPDPAPASEPDRP